MGPGLINGSFQSPLKNVVCYLYIGKTGVTSQFLPARRYASAGISRRRVSVSLSLSLPLCLSRPIITLDQLCIM